MIAFFAALGLVILSMLIIGRFVKPQPERRLPFFHKVTVLEAMPSVIFYLTVFMVTYRPGLALLATVIAFVTIVVINNAKYTALKEPLVFSDFSLLREAINHPALYVKYIGAGKLIAVVVAALAVIGGGLMLEPPVVPRDSLDAYFPTVIYLFVIFGMIYAATRGPFRNAFRNMLRGFGPSADIRRDMDQLSLLTCIILYFFLADEERENAAGKAELLAGASPSDSVKARRPRKTLALPPVVAVQSESFFDVRRLGPEIDHSILKAFDRVCSMASYRGRLLVPAWGANTMRTEFAFLSGLPNEALGVHRFNPYLQLCKKPVWTIASQFQAMGYRTVCVHPFASTFFDRDKVYPNLGFDDFLDIRDFAGAATFGPYVGDLAVADKITDLLRESDQPLFIFAITMENHGKWENDRLAANLPHLNLSSPPFESRELALYIEHIRNADSMIARIVDSLTSAPGDGIFCLFGDHLPSLPKVFNRVGYTDARTDYFVWKKSGRHPRELDVGADVLGRLVLDAVLNEVNHVEVPPSVILQK